LNSFVLNYGGKKLEEEKREDFRKGRTGKGRKES
jgi:hypothetical protein